MRQAAIIEADVLADELTAYMNDTLTIQARGGVLTANEEGAFANVTGLVDLPCIVAPQRQGAGLRIAGDFMAVDHDYTAALDDRYPSLHSATVALQAVWNGRNYGVTVDGDSQDAYTRLRLTKTEL